MDLFEFTKRFTGQNLFGSATIIEINGKYFLADEQQAELAKSAPVRPVHLGTYLGKAGERFKPGFALLEMLKPHSKKVVVNQKAAWLYLCGRDILKESVIKKDKIELKDDVIVLDQKGSVLGYGYYFSDRIRNVLDRGDFLRRERGDEDEPERSQRPGPGPVGRSRSFNRGKPDRQSREGERGKRDFSSRSSRPKRSSRPMRKGNYRRKDGFSRR